MRKKIVAGNWKMNMTPKEAVGLVNKLRDKVAGSDVEVVFCVPAIDIIPVVEAVKDTDIKVGAENMHYEEKGAFTGEISPGMLVDSGVSYVILGHSERRQYFGEDDDCINRKVRKAIEYGITPIICCGETIQQREEGITLDFIKKQINAAFTQVSPDDAADCVIAYEPIWAIGTGRVATSKQAQEVCEAIRCNIRELYGDDVAAKVRILYGGSVNASNSGFCKNRRLMVDKGCRYAMYFHYMPVGNAASVELLPTPEQRIYMKDRIRQIRSLTTGQGLFTFDFQNDGEFVGGCIAGGRNYFHINANGDAEPCVFIHYSGANIRTNTLLEILHQPLFMAYRRNQPFNKNHLRPCPMLENPEILQKMVKETGAKSTDLESPESAEHLCSKCVPYANNWKPYADNIWSETPKIKRSYENYEKH